MRSYKTEGIIIRRRNYNDADRILTVFTKTHGKIYVRATGVRRITSRRSPHIELLNHAILSLYKGNGSYPTLTEAQTLQTYADIKNDLQMIGYAYHLCELVDGLCPENQEHSQVFDLLQDSLGRLSTEGNMSLIISEFERKLLDMLGYYSQHEYVSMNFDTERFIEDILERKLKSRKIFSKLH